MPNRIERLLEKAGMNSQVDWNPEDYFFPAEWAPREATWLTWPHNKDTWPHHFQKAQQQYAAMVAAISLDEICNVSVCHENDIDRIRGVLKDFDWESSNLRFHVIPTNDSWVRDYGPIFVNLREGKVGPPAQIAINFGYNAWGGKYPPFDLDQQFVGTTGQLLEMPVYDHPLVLEGGAIESNGEGVLLTTEYCLLNSNRNTNPRKEEIEKELKRFLGVEEVWWLPGRPIVGDDTDGHIDQIARFTPDQSVLLSTSQQRGSKDDECCQENYRSLLQYTENSNYQVKQLPMPKPIVFDGQQIPASYSNYYITKKSVLVPQFEDPQDELAIEIIGSCFPDHQVKPLGSKYLSDGLGSFHCLTQQQPAI